MVRMHINAFVNLWYECLRIRNGQGLTVVVGVERGKVLIIFNYLCIVVIVFVRYIVDE